ncbi:class GN sortase [Glaciecola sp. SC05]|uniref:class GN sortase n=1 Tax=Glaciecola sp. SC05 TaxID=1987355 RepID=UPI0035284E6E
MQLLSKPAGKQRFKALALTVFILGLVFLMKGTYIQLKAALAQHLMANTWQESQHTGILRAPWPWADTEVVGKLQYLNQEQFVLAGESGRNLAFGPTLMSASSSLDEHGNTVIVGHRDTHFRELQHLALGDTILVHSILGKTLYEVTEHAVIKHTDVAVLAPTDVSVLTLITCYPFSSITADPNLRYVVRAIAKSR